MERFPAILIGGPPHSGKSVLTYSLTQALRQQGIEHYVIRAAPDGEGDWANQAAQRLVRLLRVKGDFAPAFTDFVCDSIQGRHLPVLVDAGGRPTQYQEQIFDCCTHAILLAADDASRAHWRTLVEGHGLPILAELTSVLQGEDRVQDHKPILRGTISGLERGQSAAGSTFDALVQQLAAILHHDPDDLYRIHEALCPAEIVIHLTRLARTLDVALDGVDANWQPRHLEKILDYLPEVVPLGLYGRGPNWLYAAVALLAAPSPFYQFDPRLGWLQPLSLRLETPGPDALLKVNYHETAGCVHLEGVLPAAYLDYDQLVALRVPSLPRETGVILSGKLPHWLYTSLALTYRSAPWIAVYQPQLECAVVVYSAVAERIVGECITPFPGRGSHGPA